MTINGRINSDTEHVLVVLCECARTDNITIVARLSGINVDDRDNARRSRLGMNATGLVEFEL